MVASEVIALGTPHPTELHFAGLALNNLSCVTPDEVSRILTSIPAKSSLLDFIATLLLKQCNMLFAEIIARLANMSFSQGVFPTKYKFSVVTPLLKNLTSTLMIRPTSDLSQISTIFLKSLNDYFSHAFVSVLLVISVLHSQHTNGTIQLKPHFCTHWTMCTSPLTTTNLQ